MSRPTNGSKYLENVKPRSSKHPRIQYIPVLGGTTASGWHSYKEKAPERNAEKE